MLKWIVVWSFGMMWGMGLAHAAEELVYDAHDKRDPFVPLVAAIGQSSSGLAGIEQFDEIKVEGIVYDPKAGSVAILNGAVLKEGHSLGNAKLIKIQRNGVVVSLNGTEAFMPLYQEEKKAANVQEK